FRLIFMTFHGPERFRQADGHGEPARSDPAHAGDDASHASDAHGPDAHGHDAHGHDAHGSEPHESPAVVTIPLIALAIPSVVIGYLTAGPILFGGSFGDSIRVLQHNDVLQEIGRSFQSPGQMALAGFAGAPFWLAAAGVFTAWAFFLKWPQLAERAASVL